MSRANLIEELLSTVYRPGVCFAESDAGEDAGGGGAEAGEESEAPAEGDEAPALEANEESGEVSDEEDPEEDVEFEGKAYRVPKTLKGALMRNADYTNSKKALEAERRTNEDRIKADRADIERRATVAKDQARADLLQEQIKSTREEHDKIDWEAWERQQPGVTAREMMRLQGMERQHNDLSGKVTKALEESNNKATFEQSQRVAAVNVEARKHVPDWGRDKAVTLAKFAREHRGATQEDVERCGESAFLIRLVNESYVIHEAKQKAALTKKEIKGNEDVQPKPVARVTGRRTEASAEPSDKDDANTWLKKRYKQLSKNSQGQFQRSASR